FSTSPSAATRSRSSWSITATSPGWIRRRRFLVQRSTRATRAAVPLGRGRRLTTLRATVAHLEPMGESGDMLEILAGASRVGPWIRRIEPEVGGGPGHGELLPEQGEEARRALPAHQPGRPGGRFDADPRAHGELEGRSPVRRQDGRLLPQDLERHTVIRREHDRPVEDHVRGDRREEEAGDLWRHDRTAG